METFSQYIQWHAVFATLKLYLVSSIPRPCSRGWYHWRSKVGADNRSNCRETGVSAQIMLVRLAKWSWLKAWAMKIARHRGMKKAIVALARRLAVIMHRIWVNGTAFRWTQEQAAAAT